MCGCTQASTGAAQCDCCFASIWFRFIVTCRPLILLQTFSTGNAWQTYIATVLSPCSRARFFVTEILFLERYKHSQQKTNALKKQSKLSKTNY